MTVEGVVTRLNYARHGEANGVVLDGGDFLHLKPDGMKRVELKVGQPIKAHGSRISDRVRRSGDRGGDRQRGLDRLEEASPLSERGLRRAGKMSPIPTGAFRTGTREIAGKPGKIDVFPLGTRAALGPIIGR